MHQIDQLIEYLEQPLKSRKNTIHVRNMLFSPIINNDLEKFKQILY